MASRASGPPGGAQVITTFNGGNVVSTQVPSLNFDGQNAGDLIKTITGIQPNMVNGVTMDNTYVGHQQYRYLPYPVNNRTMTFQYTTPNWCHVRDMALNLQLVIRACGPQGRTAMSITGNEFTRQKIYGGLYHITNGGLLSIFQNMRIKLGAQVDIFTAFEKTKSAYHILNTWLRGKWDQKDVFSLIDRWDAWYPSGLTLSINPRLGAVQAALSLTINAAYWGTSMNTVAPQSDMGTWERRLSKVLADRGLQAQSKVDLGISDNRFVELIENVSFSFDKLHSLFQQNIMLPPGLQFIIEVDLPMYSNFVPGQQENIPAGFAQWANIGFITPSYQDTLWQTTALDDTVFQPNTYYTGCSPILVSVNQTSVFNSITMNCVNMKPEIARSLQDARIKSPLVYNYSQMVATTVGSYFEGQSVYNFTLPPNQAIPTQFIFAWVNPTMYLGPDNTGIFPGQAAGGTNPNAPQLGTYNLNTAEQPPTTGYGPYQFDGPNVFNQMATNQFLGSSLTPLPVAYKRMIVRRGGFQEVYQYGTYYDGLGANSLAFTVTPPTGSNPMIIANSVTMFGAKNITPDSSQKYFDHLEEYQWDRKSVNGLGPIERRLKYSYTQAYLSEGKWMAFQLNPCKNDVGQYSSDQNAYSVDVQLEMDWELLNSVRWSGLNANSKLVCIRVLPAQLSYAIDGTVRIYTWPNLLISPNAVVSGNPPPAGPGGSI
jgi:hypothetical protein